MEERAESSETHFLLSTYYILETMDKKMHKTMAHALEEPVVW